MFFYLAFVLAGALNVSAAQDTDYSEPLMDHVRVIEVCYQAALKRDPYLEGSLSWGYKVDEQGQCDPRGSGMSISFTDEVLQECIEGQIKQMAFLQTEGGQVWILDYCVRLYVPRYNFSNS
jgi:hypothetical protein